MHVRRELIKISEDVIDASKLNDLSNPGRIKYLGPKRHDELYNAISHYLDNDSFRLKHGKSGREMVIDKFKPEDIWEKLYQEYL